MKRILIIISVILVATNLLSQPPSGRRGQGGPPPNGGRMGQRPPSNIEDNIILESFPEIPNLTLQQREKVGTILTDEQKDIEKQMAKKREAEVNLNPDATQKEVEKQQKEIEKIDKKVQDIRGKSDKKIKKILSDEQYLVFTQKREEFKFRHQRRQRPPQRKDYPDEDMPSPPFQNQNFE